MPSRGRVGCQVGICGSCVAYQELISRDLRRGCDAATALARDGTARPEHASSELWAQSELWAHVIRSRQGMMGMVGNE